MAHRPPPSDLAQFVSLLSTTEEERRDVNVVKQLASQVLEAFERKQVRDHCEDVLAVSLKLIQKQRDDELVALLLRILRVLNRQMRWTSRVSSKVAPELVRLLFSDSITAGGTTFTILVALLTEITLVTPKTSVAVQEALSECIKKLQPDKQSESVYWEQLDRLQLTRKFAVVAEILRDGSTKEQELMLKCLLTNPLMIRARIVISHRGTELMLELWERARSQVVKALALVFVNDLASQIPKYRMHMLNVWLQHKQNASLVIAESEFLQALAVEGEDDFVGEELLRTLQCNSVDVTFLRPVNALEDNDVLIVHLCERHNLLDAIERLLSRERRNNGLDLRVRSRLRMLLSNVLEKEPRIPELSSAVAAGIKSLIEMVKPESTREKLMLLREISQRLEAGSSRSPDGETYEATVATIPTLVKRLAELSDDESSQGRDLIASLRVYAAAGSSLGGYAREIDQAVASVLSDKNGESMSLLAEDRRPVVYFQNLLLFYRDIPGVRLGRTTGIDKVISAAGVAELLRTRGSDIEKLLMIKFLHNELGLNLLDPVRCEIQTDARAVVKAIAEHLDDVISVAVSGNAEAKTMTRRILTLVARGDKTSRAKLRAYQSWHPAKPALVMAEVIENESGDGGVAENPEQKEEEESYEYSDDEDDAKDRTAPRECEVLQGAEQESSGGDDAKAQEREAQGTRADVSVGDDWEFV